MNRMITAFVLIVAMLLVSAPGAGATPPGQKFAGTWTGTWTGAGQSGTVQFVVNAGGSVTGTIVNQTAGITGTLSGTLDRDGGFEGSVFYPGQTVEIAACFHKPHGRPNRARGMFSQVFNGQLDNGRFVVTRPQP